MRLSVLLPFAVLCSFVFVTSGTCYTDRIIAIVNKDVITLSELKNEVRDEHTRLRARFSGTELNRRVAQKELQVLNMLIERRLQLQEAKAKGFTATGTEIDTALQQSGSPAKIDLPSESPLIKQTRERILLGKIRDFEVRRIVTISETEISQYYDDHQERFMVSPTYRLRQILLLANSEEDRIHKQVQAKMVSERLQEGEDFAELALQYSAGPAAAERGELGLVQRDELLPPIAKGLTAMQPGDISRPIETTLGFHIVALDNIIPQAPKPLEEVENEIRTLLHKQWSDQVFQHWLTELKKKAFIEIKYSPRSNS